MIFVGLMIEINKNLTKNFQITKYVHVKKI